MTASYHRIYAGDHWEPVFLISGDDLKVHLYRGMYESPDQVSRQELGLKMTAYHHISLSFSLSTSLFPVLPSIVQLPRGVI